MRVNGKRGWLIWFCVGVALLGFAPAVIPEGKGPHIEWDDKTRVRVAPGTYGRMVRLSNNDVLCSYEGGGKAWVTQSGDDGKTWNAPQMVRSLPFANAANPELLVLHGGRILLFYNQRPHDKMHPFAIGACFSDNHGKTWHSLPKNLYEAGTGAAQGCWEPAAVQAPSGEIHLFFANEFPYPKNDDQEITRLRSRDEGLTWDKGETACFRPGHRDGMPVPLLQGNEIIFAIEDNGLKPGYVLQPALIAVPTEKGAAVVGLTVRAGGKRLCLL